MKKSNTALITSELTRLEGRLSSEKNPSIRRTLAKEIGTLRSKLPPSSGKGGVPHKNTVPARGIREIQILEAQLISPNLSPAGRRELNIRLMAVKAKYGLLSTSNTKVEDQVAKTVNPVYKITKSNNYKNLINSEK